MVEVGNVLRHVKREGELSMRRECRGIYVQEKCPNPVGITGRSCSKRPG